MELRKEYDALREFCKEQIEAGFSSGFEEEANRRMRKLATMLAVKNLEMFMDDKREDESETEAGVNGLAVLVIAAAALIELGVLSEGYENLLDKAVAIAHGARSEFLEVWADEKG